MFQGGEAKRSYLKTFSRVAIENVAGIMSGILNGDAMVGVLPGRGNTERRGVGTTRPVP